LETNRGLPLLLLSVLLLIPACDSSSVSEPLGISSLPTPTPKPLPTATFTTAPMPTLSPTFTITSSPTPVSTPTATLPPAPRPALTMVEIAGGSSERPWIALTFDASWDLTPLPSILETLRQKDVRCTFFITGITLRQEQGPELVQEIVADGHELGNHSDTHLEFTQLTDEEIGAELAVVEETVLDLTGQSTKPYFRPPFGARDARVLGVVQENGYLTIMWTYHVWDWVEDRTAESVYNYAVEGARNGAIVVMHVGAQETADALPLIIEELQARGYRLVTLSELLAP
jgi:peptidoglycan/xylan/chitin deacetylase (PgdA/CDA1 family)